MKKLGKKGFTLIELLAVITIMGILLLVAIPAVSRTIENSRRDTFASTTSEYLNAVRNAVLADNVECYYGSAWTIASATPDGTYYFPICTSEGSCTDVKAADPGKLDKKDVASSTKDLMESGGRSSFGNAELEGYVTWSKTTTKTDPNNPKTTTTYKILLNDTGKHGFDTEVDASALKRSQVKTNLSKVKSNVMTPPAATTVYYCRMR